MNSRLQGRAVLAVLAAGLCFGTTGTAQSLLGKNINPLAIGSSRLVVGAIALWLFGLRKPKPSKRVWGAPVVAAIGIAGYQLAFFSAVHLTGVAIATITALGSSPLFTGSISWVLGHERPNKVWFQATSLSSLGILLLNLRADHTNFNATGVLLALAASAGFSAFNIAGRKLLASGYPSTHFTSQSFAISAALIFPFIFIDSTHWLVTVRGLGMILWLGLISTALAYSLYSYGLTHMRASNVATLVLAEPVTATLLAVTVLHNHLSMTSWLGVAIVLLGLFYLGAKG